MKKKIYLVMVPVYLLVVMAVLYLNGTLTGQKTSIVNLVINLAFLVFIAILMIFSILSLKRQSDVISDIEEFNKKIKIMYKQKKSSVWDGLKDESDVFKIKILNDGFHAYQKAMKKKGDAEISDYINEDMIERVGKAYLNSALPGIFTGIGILGTFLGLSFGMMSFNGSDIFTISDNVGPLLEGMKVAFHTSVYGMVFSLTFTFVYRSFMAYSYEKLKDFYNAFEEYAAPEGEGRNSSFMLMYQSNILSVLENISDLLEGASAHQVNAVNLMMERFTDNLSKNASSDIRGIGTALIKSLENQKVHEDNIKKLTDGIGILLETCQNLRDVVEDNISKDEALREKLIKETKRLSGEVYTLSINK